jgi:hypothetical protein
MSPRNDAARALAERLVRETDRTLASIAAEAGVTERTVCVWGRQNGWRRPVRPAPPPPLEPSEWSLPRLEAVARLHANPSVASSDLAAALGSPRGGAAALFSACGLSLRRRVVRRATASGPGLRRALRRHIARQIAGFDAALTAGAGPADSAKVLRDLGGLKRLLDEITADESKEAGHGTGTAGLAPGPAPPDLPALRAEIARRYAAFAGERPDAGLPREPAAAADPGARH